MKDDQKLFAELSAQALDSEHEQVLTDLCQELLKEFESGSAEAATGMIRLQIEKRRNAYSKAHKALMETIGL